MPKGVVVENYDAEPVTHRCEWQGRGLQYEIDEVYDCVQQGNIESRHFCHHFSLDLIDTMDEIRRQTGIQYAVDAD